MREILFRGKRVSNGEWVYGNYAFTDTNDEQHFIFQNEAFANKVIPETVEQYTGLTDKNGTKIFEGDIIEGIHQQIFVVEYGRHDLDCCNCCYESHDALGFYMKNKFGSAESNEKVWEDIEVIGNIHDNPELLGDANV